MTWCCEAVGMGLQLAALDWIRQAEYFDLLKPHADKEAEAAGSVWLEGHMPRRHLGHQV